jgi:hypothetical protein
MSGSILYVSSFEYSINGILVPAVSDVSFKVNKSKLSEEMMQFPQSISFDFPTGKIFTSRASQ